MASCSLCNGYGQLQGDYPPCYSCGGRGCMACHNTGRGGMRSMTTCYNCGGSGKIADPPSPRPVANARAKRPRVSAGSGAIQTGAPTAKPYVPWTNRDRLVAAVTFAAVCAALTLYSGYWSWGYPLVGLVCAIVTGRFWKGMLTFSLLGGGVALALWYSGWTGSAP